MSGQLVEVRFKGSRKSFFRWADPEPLAPDEAVIVETDRGLDWGRVAATGAVASLKCERCLARLRAPKRGGAEHEAESAEAGPAAESSPLPPAAAQPERRVVRRATAADTKIAEEQRYSEDDVRRKVREKVAAHRLQMKVSDAEWQWDRNRLTVYFTAERRV
ncbi:MAG TPA: PSP1 domain-containing protein, partial [Gemmatimonadales bacterium]|nr:PSP1 domain-containing protein [Gemmatimonadales bacterium]